MSVSCERRKESSRPSLPSPIAPIDNCTDSLCGRPPGSPLDEGGHAVLTVRRCTRGSYDGCSRWISPGGTRGGEYVSKPPTRRPNYAPQRDEGDDTHAANQQLLLKRSEPAAELSHAPPVD
jgi:hypothetical protein